MTVDTDNNEPYRESKEHVLSHYFDELLPDDVPASEQGCSDELAEEQTKEQIKPSKPSHIDNTPPVEDYLAGHIKEQAINETEPTRHFKQSEPLTPLNDKKPTESQNESVAYQAHKQRLEKMLQQLTPMNPLPSLSETQSVVTPSDTKGREPDNLTKAPDDASTDTDIEAVEPQTLLAQTFPLSSEWLDNGRPNWAQEAFDILLIDVNGLKLALPLVALGHIEPIEEDLTPLFGQSEWFLGIQKTPFGNIKTIDTVQYVMPERASQVSEKAYRFVVSISGMNWGLAVDSIDQPIAIDPEAIRWRANRSNRPWMAGTVKDHMCVLLDIPVMGEILQKEDQNHRNPTGE